jgi:long-chain acyl-CoA synthetase
MGEIIHTADHQYDQGTFKKEVWSYVEYFTSKGLKEEERVLVTSDNSYQLIVTLFALVQKGSSIVLVDSQMKESEVKNIAKALNCNLCISDRSFAQSVELQTIVIPLENIQPSNREDSLSISLWRNKRDALILYSSGSTGSPKGIVKSGRSFIENIESTIVRMNYNDKDVLQPLVPFTHFYGLSIIFIWWLTKCELVICNYKKIRPIIKAITEKKVTVVDAVPSTYYILNRLLTKRNDTLMELKSSSVRMWCIGGSPLAKKLGRDFKRLMEKDLLDGYGLSELGNVTLNTDSHELGCGKPLPGIQIKVTDKSGEEMQAGEIGEIIVKSTGIMEGYIVEGSPELMLPESLWFNTKDVGFKDIDGNLHVIGRKGNEILRNGYLIYPAAIEKQLEDNLGLKTRAFPIGDEKKGSRILLFAEVAANEETMVKRAISQTLSSLLKPDFIICMEDFPKLSNGKIDQKAIKAMANQWESKRKEEITWVM